MPGNPDTLEPTNESIFVNTSRLTPMKHSVALRVFAYLVLLVTPGPATPDSIYVVNGLGNSVGEYNDSSDQFRLGNWA